MAGSRQFEQQTRFPAGLGTVPSCRRRRVCAAGRKAASRRWVPEAGTWRAHCRFGCRCGFLAWGSTQGHTGKARRAAANAAQYWSSSAPAPATRVEAGSPLCLRAVWRLRRCWMPPTAGWAAASSTATHSPATAHAVPEDIRVMGALAQRQWSAFSSGRTSPAGGVIGRGGGVGLARVQRRADRLFASSHSQAGQLAALLPAKPTLARTPPARRPQSPSARSPDPRRFNPPLLRSPPSTAPAIPTLRSSSLPTRC